MRNEFKVGQEVAFTAEARTAALNAEEFLGVFIVEDVADNLQGAAALAHPQSVRLRGRADWVSGHLIEDIHHVDEPLIYEPSIIKKVMQFCGVRA